MNKYQIIFAALTFTLFVLPAMAAEPEPTSFTGAIEVGGAYLTGDTTSTTLNGRIALGYEGERFGGDGKLEYFSQSTDGIEEVRNGIAEVTGRYSLTPRYYLFSAIQYEEKSASGYNSRANESIGIGWRAIQNDTVTLTLEAGSGGRHSRPVESADTNETIGRFRGMVTVIAGETLTFKEIVNVVTGAQDTTTLSETSLTTPLLFGVALKLLVQATFQTNPPVETKGSDVLTTLTLLYAF